MKKGSKFELKNCFIFEGYHETRFSIKAYDVVIITSETNLADLENELKTKRLLDGVYKMSCFTKSIVVPKNIAKGNAVYCVKCKIKQGKNFVEEKDYYVLSDNIIQAYDYAFEYLTERFGSSFTIFNTRRLNFDSVIFW